MNETESTRADAGGRERNSDQSQQSDAAPEAPKKTAKRAKRPPIGSLTELIQTTYGTKAGVKTLQKADTKALLSGSALNEADRDELLKLARSDNALEKTKQLMLLSVRSEAPKIANGLREFAREVLKRHALFQRPAMAGLLANPQSMSMDTAVGTLLATDVKVLTSHSDNPLPKSQVDRCRTNGARCLLLLLWATQGTSLHRIQRCMQKHLWDPKARRYRSEKQKFEALITSRDPNAASVTFGLLEGQVREQEQRAETAARAEERALTSTRRLEQQVTELEDKLRQTSGECEQRRQQLHDSTEAHSTKEAHWRHEHETLKGQTLRRLNEDSSLLEEGLHALRRDPPKIGVMIDHAERAIDGLKRAAERIRRDTLS